MNPPGERRRHRTKQKGMQLSARRRLVGQAIESDFAPRSCRVEDETAPWISAPHGAQQLAIVPQDQAPGRKIDREPTDAAALQPVSELCRAGKARGI